MRLAEKKGRASTCAFADEAALATISAYRLHVPLELQEAYKQTVLAGILLLDTEAAALTVVALGVGTKVRQADGSDGGATTLRDMHAEVLARRGLQRYLCIQLQRHQTGDGGGIFSATAGDGRLGLRAGLSFHIYSSSQPCGNACVKRWAKSRRPAVYAGLGRYEWPIDSHARLQVSARANGQVAPLLKRVRISNEEEADGDERGEQEGGVTFAFPPPGITLCTSMSSKPLSCSDKIAKWQCLGLQGSLLAGRLLPVKLSTVTVGRKFSLVHLERAVCCRYQAWRAPGGYVVQHPAMLCTAQKFDPGLLEGAVFDEWRCFVWWRDGGGGGFDVLDGRSGSSLLSAGNPSPISSSELHEAVRGLGGPWEDQQHKAAKLLFLEHTERHLAM